MATKCATCGSVRTEPLADRYQCVDCGHCTFTDGTAATAGQAAQHDMSYTG